MIQVREKLLLQSFLSGYDGLKKIKGKVDRLSYERLSIDSRTIEPGELFLALHGENHDGHAYIPQVVQKGASGAIVEKSWYNAHPDEIPSDFPLVVVENTLHFLQQLAAWHRRQFEIPVIGITGSNGKTTTREMTAHVLSRRYRVFRNEGNKNNHIGVPLMLLQLREDHEVAVFEMASNHAGEIALLAGLTQPTMGVVTNIGKAHLGYFGSLHDVYKEKTALFEAIPATAPIVINMEDPLLRSYPRENRRVITVGYSSDYDVFGKIVSHNKLGAIRFLLNNRVQVSLQIPGAHQLLNALIASAVALEMGLSEDEIADALASFQPASQRMEIKEMNGVTIINDAYNANPDSMRKAVDYLTSLKTGDGKKILILGDMLELGAFSEDEHRELGRYIAEKDGLSEVLLYGPDSRFIKEGIKSVKAKKLKCYHYPRHLDITRHLRQILHPGDVLLLKGSRGMQMERVLYGLFEQEA
ncbi:MAG: UDP-N-acetylmuramoyl-tripeptide--D-alanyl-D-alanine ligase [Calditrichaeota bacterium]|nr:MAG: UDP-N-acetylmuramoyl-tripeptide--D-alanyl-D-alanine ligase [Calditrichota bacterium]